MFPCVAVVFVAQPGKSLEAEPNCLNSCVHVGAVPAETGAVLDVPDVADRETQGQWPRTKLQDLTGVVKP